MVIDIFSAAATPCRVDAGMAWSPGPRASDALEARLPLDVLAYVDARVAAGAAADRLAFLTLLVERDRAQTKRERLREMLAGLESGGSACMNAADLAEFSYLIADASCSPPQMAG